MKTCGICTNAYEDKFVTDGVCDFCNPENEIVDKPVKSQLPKSIANEEYSTKAVMFIMNLCNINAFGGIIIWILGIFAWWFDPEIKSFFQVNGLGYSAAQGILILMITLFVWGLCRIYIQISQDIRKIRKLLENREA